MAPEDVYRLGGVSDVRLSPEGSTIAYVMWRIDREANEYTSTIWLRSNKGEPRQFTFGPRRDAMPRWSPDGNTLAFVSNRDRDGLQLHVISLLGGEARKLTEFKDEDVSDVAWSPDGQH
ncbi:MAG: TolB family protein, partial [Actinomycetota bacterium]